MEPVEIRIARPEDAPALAAFYVRNEAYLAPFEPAGELGDRSTAAAVLHRVTPSDQRMPLVALDGEELIGAATLSNIARGAWQNCTLGYSVDEQYVGRGIGTALACAAVDVAFGHLGLHRIEAGTLVDNVASQRVLEKSGFRRIGVSPRHLQIAGTWQDHVLYSLTVEDTPHGS